MLSYEVSFLILIITYYEIAFENCLFASGNCNSAVAKINCSLQLVSVVRKGRRFALHASDSICFMCDIQMKHLLPVTLDIQVKPALVVCVSVSRKMFSP